MSKSVDSFRLSAELQCGKEITMLKDENAALKAQVSELYSCLEYRDGGDHDIDCKVNSGRQCNCGHNYASRILDKSPQACLNDHNARIEEEVIGRCADVALKVDKGEIKTEQLFQCSASVMGMPRKYKGDK